MHFALNSLEQPAGAPDTPRAASSWADGRFAVRDAIADALARVPGAQPSVVLLFPDAGIPRAAVLAQAAAAAPGCRLAGMTSDGLVTGAGVVGHGCSALAFGPEVAVGIGVAEDASIDMHAAGRTAAEQALRRLRPRSGHAVLLLFLDPTSGDEG